MKYFQPWLLILSAACALMVAQSFSSEIRHDESTAINREDESHTFAIELETEAPLWTGVGARVMLGDHFSFGGGIGFMPNPYATLLGQGASYYGGNHAYQLLIETGFQSNVIPSANINYHFTGERGFHLGASSYFLHSTGTLTLQDALQSQSGIDMSAIQAALASSGLGLALNSTSDLIILGGNLGYTFKFDSHWGFDASAGVAKIVSSSVTLNTSVPMFDQSSVGQMVRTEAANQIQQILNSYGITPLLSVSVQYLF